MNETPMSIDEARSVMWLCNNHCPLGELLDEGFLTQARLEWAAEKAYDPRLKQAAGVLLEYVKGKSPVAKVRTETAPAALDAGMTIDQARSVIWPIPPHKGKPMGPLVDSQELSLKDLGYAIENAWEEQVRRAAAVLSAMRINQAVKEPPPPAGPLNVISSGRSYAQRREIRLTFLQGLIIGAMFMLCLVGVGLAVRQMVQARPATSLAEILSEPVGIVALAILVFLGVGTMWAVWVLPNWGLNRLDAQIENYRRGQEGEDRVAETLGRHLDGQWTLFRNVTLPGRNKADLDMVLMGPPGVYVLEVKAFAGAYRNIGEHWKVRSDHKWKSLDKSPSRQAQNSAVRLANFLRADGIQQWVEPVVVWAEPSSALSVENPMVAVWTLERLSEEVGNIWARRTMDPSVQERIVEKLTLLCQQQKGNAK